MPDTDNYACFLVLAYAEMIDLLSQNEANISVKIGEADKLLFHAADQGKIKNSINYKYFSSI